MMLYVLQSRQQLGDSASVGLLRGRITCRAGWLMRCRPIPPSLPRSGFAGFRFPPEVITMAVRWYLRYGLC
jgi:hypothetical protein